IYGAWVAADAALRGLSVALVERTDWGAGTSSRSSKLIHGGLRYLRGLHLRLVRKSLAERRLLARLAPHQVRPLRFLFPADGTPAPLVAAGLTLYDLLAGRDQPVAPHARLEPAAAARRCPFLDGARGRPLFSYGDCATDDARLTLEVVAQALAAGAVAVNHATVRHLLASRAGVAGAAVACSLTGREVEVRARLTVLAAGPWSEGLLPGGGRRPWARYTKGVHLVMEPLPCAEALLLVARSDRRVFFVIPWYGASLVGTTDTDYRGDPDRVAVEEADVAYLLGELAAHAPGLGWGAGEIRGAFAGLRTLRHQPGRSPSSVSREWRLVEPRPGLLMPVGGKLTAARADAAAIVDRACRRTILPEAFLASSE
ncbi:MAG: FAD-dependent oxidoreductase, partial [Nitrospirae bacterium]